jgi:hypothetical protein
MSRQCGNDGFQRKAVQGVVGLSHANGVNLGNLGGLFGMVIF